MMAAGIVAGLLQIALVSAFAAGDWQALRANQVLSPASGLSFLILLSSAWIRVSVGARRAHDRGQSGLAYCLYEIAGFMWIAGGVAFQALDLGLPPVLPWAWILAAIGILNVLAALYFLVTLGFLDGDPTANAYGLSPKGPARSGGIEHAPGERSNGLSG